MPRGVYPRSEWHGKRMSEGILSSGGRSGDNNPNWRGGKSTHPLYHIYNDIKLRCSDPRHPRYRDYGKRGITMCQRWLNDFWLFVDDVGPRPASDLDFEDRAYYSLDRVNNDGGYEPGNVRWATPSEQRINQRPKQRSLFCAKGLHEFSPETTQIGPTGKRRCIPCYRDWYEGRKESKDGNS